MATQPDPRARHTSGRLREFSVQLAQRLKDAPAQASQTTRLAVRIGADHYLVEMALAGEIVAVPQIAPVPWTRPWYRGLANVRGRLVGVVDFLHLTGRAPLPADDALQLLVLSPALNVNAGLLISRAFGIRNLKDLEPLGPSAAHAGWETERWRDLDGTVLTELNLRELAASSAFTAIGT